jgi:hypothetical protein
MWKKLKVINSQVCVPVVSLNNISTLLVAATFNERLYDESKSNQFHFIIKRLFRVRKHNFMALVQIISWLLRTLFYGKRKFDSHATVLQN